MVGFTVSLLGWLACALFRFFVIAGTSYGIYRLIKDKIDERERNKYVRECQEKHKREMKEAKERISKLAEQGRKKKFDKTH